jgi:hypothetical protein
MLFISSVFVCKPVNPVCVVCTTSVPVQLVVPLWAAHYETRLTSSCHMVLLGAFLVPTCARCSGAKSDFGNVAISPKPRSFQREK